MKTSRLSVILVLVALLTLSSMSAAETDALARQAKACDDNVAYFRGHLDSAIAWTNTFMIAGALIAALGSAFAGFLSKEEFRRIAAVLGAVGAVITVLPKTLPDKEKLQAHLSAAEKQRVLGAKVQNQLGFARPGESIVEAQKYVSARFTDCASVDPPAAAPDLPMPREALSSDVHANIPADSFVPALGSSGTTPIPKPLAAPSIFWPSKGKVVPPVAKSVFTPQPGPPQPEPEFGPAMGRAPL
jgi:hypothetical protein